MFFLNIHLVVLLLSLAIDLAVVVWINIIKKVWKWGVNAPALDNKSLVLPSSSDILNSNAEVLRGFLIIQLTTKKATKSPDRIIT